MYHSISRAKHSTETALLKVRSEVLSSLDVEGAVIIVLVMFDSSGAFDHVLLLSRLRDMSGIGLIYLSDRLQQVNIKKTLSDKQELSFLCSLVLPVH